MRPVDPRLVRQAASARGFLALSTGAGLVTAGAVLLQAQLLAHALSRRGVGLRSTFVLLAVVLVVRASMSYIVEASAVRAAAAVRRDLRARLLAAVVARGPAWLGTRSPGEVITLATRGLDALDPYFARYLPQLVLACLVPLAVLARIAAADWISALVIALTIPLIPVFMALVGMHTREATARQWTTLSRLGGHFLDVVQGLPTLAVFGRAKAQAEVIWKVSDSNRRATMATLRAAFLSAVVLELLATIATALVAVEVGLRLLAGHLPYETALLVLLLTPEAYLPLRNVGAQFHASMEGATAVAAALDVCEVPETPAVHSICHFGRDVIRFEGVTVRYADRDRPSLERCDLTVRPGDRIAIVGPSGAGKTTIQSLLLGWVRPTAGRVVVGGRDMSDFDPRLLREQIAWVPQQPHLFVGSVAANIRIGRPGATEHQVRAAADSAGLLIPLDTDVEEAGASLSSGERQRVALARAFLRDAPLLLLDEPTAHLDSEAAAGVRQVIEHLVVGRTVLLVTHDESLVAAMHRAIAVDGGHVYELEPVAT